MAERARILTLLCLLGAGCGLLAVRSQAASQFGSRGSASGQLIEPQGIAVDRASGDVYVVDSNNLRVDKFTSGGSFMYAWGWGVADGTTRAPQVCAARCHAGLPGTGPGQLGFAEGVAVDDAPSSSSRGDVYVVDLSGLRVEKFNAAGEFLLTFGKGVNESARQRGERGSEDICPLRPGDRCGAGSQGAGDGEFRFRAEGDLVAVGPDGTVYVGDLRRVQEFSPAGVYERQVRLLAPEVRGVEAGAASGLAVDATGNLYVVENGFGGVAEYSPAGGLLRVLDYQGDPEGMEGPTPTIALDASGDLFVDEHRPRHAEYAPKPHLVVEYDPNGIELTSFDAGREDGLHGIAYGDRVGKLYIVNANSDVVPPIARVRIVAPPASREGFACDWCGWTGAGSPR